MQPIDHANALIGWLGQRQLAEVATRLHGDWPALATHADALADAADSADESQRSAGLQALFAGLIEPLNDGFRPAGRALYARAFGAIVWRVCARDSALRDALAACGITSEAALIARHGRVRLSTARLPDHLNRIVIPSRVTIGADVLLTTVLLQRLHQAYPTAELIVIGDAKLAPLIGGLPNVRVHPVAYGRRGALRERLASWLVMRDAITQLRADAVIAPDSRLDQLGILPLGDEQTYRLWENTQPEGKPADSLAALLDRWCQLVLPLPKNAPAVLPRVALDAATQARRERMRAAIVPKRCLAVKLDHGGNAAKALPRESEIAVLRAATNAGWRIIIDRGFGAAELANSDALCDALGWKPIDLDDGGAVGLAIDALTPAALQGAQVIRIHGSIATWAAALSLCDRALAYDSVGHHLAAALGIPVVTAFTGYSDPSFPIAWQPRGSGHVTLITIAAADRGTPATIARIATELTAP